MQATCEYTDCPEHAKPPKDCSGLGLTADDIGTAKGVVLCGTCGKPTTLSAA